MTQLDQSESLTKLLPALIKARAEFPALIKDSKNDHFRSRYADLAAVLDACDGVLGRHDLAILQVPRLNAENGSLTLLTTLCHTSGEWIRASYPVLADVGRPQVTGAGLTYARRYSYMAVAGIAPEDDDGETASGRGTGHHVYARNGHTNGATNGSAKPQVAAPAAPPRCVKCQTDLGEMVNTPLGPICWECCERQCQTCKRTGKSRTTLANGEVICKPCYKRREDDRERAAFVSEPAPAPATSNGRPPISGRELYRWAAQIEHERGPGLIAHMLERARPLGLPDRIVAWSSAEVPAAYEDALACLELIYDRGDADVDYDDADEHYN
jgi:hypothetical protein